MSTSSSSSEGEEASFRGDEYREEDDDESEEEEGEEEEEEDGGDEEEDEESSEEEDEEEAYEDDDDSDDDVPLSKLRGVVDDEDDDDDDDIPLVKLRSPKEKKPAAKKRKAPAKTTKAKKKTTTTTKKKKKKTTSSSSASDNDIRSASALLYSNKSVKGLLIQRLLCRWWYAIDWPAVDKSVMIPPTFDALDGFPGVYVGTQGDDVGKLLDTRNMDDKPSFAAFARRKSTELKELLQEALEKQMEDLKEAEGDDAEKTPTGKEIKTMTTWVKRVNADKADKDAEKLL